MGFLAGFPRHTQGGAASDRQPFLKPPIASGLFRVFFSFMKRTWGATKLSGWRSAFDVARRGEMLRTG
jgi:hypothetical protein